MIYIYDGGSLSVTEEEKKKKDFYSSSIRLGFGSVRHQDFNLGKCNPNKA